jgi:hypothetical protein
MLRQMNQKGPPIMITKISLRRSPGQRGAATLAVALILLIGVTITILYTASITISEQRMSANELRAKSAAAAAQAGLDSALATNFTEADPGTVIAGTVGMAAYRAIYWAGDAPLPAACPDTPGPFIDEASNHPTDLRSDFRIISCGWSDDRSAGRAVVARAVLTPALNDVARTAPLVARGNVNTAGRGKVYNYYTNITIWTGEGLDVIGNAGTTFIRNPQIPPGNPNFDLATETPNCNTVQETTLSNPYVCTTRGNSLGPDVVLGDRSLEGLTAAEFFALATGIDSSSWAELKAVFIEQFSPLETSEASDLTDPDNAGKLIWFDGNLSLNGGSVGTENAPVLLIVDGNATIRGEATFYGVVFVVQNLVTGGNPVFLGSTLVGGHIAPDTGPGAAGNPSFIYSPNAISQALEATSIGIVAGTWRDWL